MVTPAAGTKGEGVIPSPRPGLKGRPSLAVMVMLSLVLVADLVLAVAQLMVQRQVLLPSFAMLERQSAKTDIARVDHAVQRELDLMGVSALNWGNWEEPYRFMQDHHQEFVKQNLYPAAIRSMKIDALMMIGADGNYVWSGAYDPASGNPMDIDLVTRGALPDNHPWRPALSAGTSIQGLIGTNRGTMLAALSPVLDGQGRGPHRGAVLIGRLLTGTEIARIGEQAQTKLTSTDLQMPGSAAPAALPPGAILEGPDALVELDISTDIYRTLDDIYGRPLIRLRGEIPRAISAQGRETLAYAVAFLTVTGAIVLIVLLVVLNRSILSPLSRITHHAVAIGKNENRPARLNIDRKDELGILAQEFERMMDRLMTARRELVDRSFESGAAEMASGTLHNIGNAMTPLTVEVAALQARLHAAPADDVRLAVAELDRVDDDPARQADIVHFLRLTSIELADLVQSAEGEIATIARQTQAVQDALAEQQDFKRGGTIEETVSLAELVDHSLEIVPLALRQRLSIERDDSVMAIGPVRLARTTLQQVLQNLIVNAAESARAAGHDRGVLRISAAMLPGSHRGELHLQFHDNGAGITAAHLKRIFERGFSTKSRDTNSGIGLHWCANALNALGGAIRATSDGPGRGACVHVMIPVERPETMSLAEVA